MKIALNAHEKDTLNRAIAVLTDYSRVYSAMVENKRGMNFDRAGSAINMINEIIKESDDLLKEGATV